jgi:hypothetical protein
VALGEIFRQVADEGFRVLGCTENAQEPIKVQRYTFSTSIRIGKKWMLVEP